MTSAPSSSGSHDSDDDDAAAADVDDITRVSAADSAYQAAIASYGRNYRPRVRPWSISELRALVEGVDRCGLRWRHVLRSARGQLHCSRTEYCLEKQWDALVRGPESELGRQPPAPVLKTFRLLDVDAPVILRAEGPVDASRQAARLGYQLIRFADESFKIYNYYCKVGPRLGEIMSLGHESTSGVLGRLRCLKEFRGPASADSSSSGESFSADDEDVVDVAPPQLDFEQPLSNVELIDRNIDPVANIESNQDELSPEAEPPAILMRETSMSPPHPTGFIASLSVGDDDEAVVASPCDDDHSVFASPSGDVESIVASLSKDNEFINALQSDDESVAMSQSDDPNPVVALQPDASASDDSTVDVDFESQINADRSPLNISREGPSSESEEDYLQQFLNEFNDDDYSEPEDEIIATTARSASPVRPASSVRSASVVQSVLINKQSVAEPSTPRILRSATKTPRPTPVSRSDRSIALRRKCDTFKLLLTQRPEVDQPESTLHRNTIKPFKRPKRS